jgi:ribonuclease D
LLSTLLRAGDVSRSAEACCGFAARREYWRETWSSRIQVFGVIDTEEKLAAYLARVQSVDWMAVDTEADSLHAYPEKVCLIQITTSEGDELIDPLAEVDLAPLLEGLSGHELIMHGADYDLRLLRKHHEFVPRAIFDTMLAARLLGVPQFSLSDLVENYLGVKLEKGAQKANWAMRPLTEKMERYALHDTHYLHPLSEKLKVGLREKNRLEWHQESCARLIQDTARARGPDPETVWRIKGSHILGRPALAILRELWRWRETEAVAANKPPFFVFNHDKLVEIAATASMGRPVETLLPRYFSERRRTGVLQAIAAGREVPENQMPKILENVSRKPNEAERKRFLELQAIRDRRATEIAIDPTLIASRSTMSDLAHDWDKNQQTLMSWQKNLLTDG